MAELIIVFLQDAAAMLVKFPERSACAMYRMEVFQDPDWNVSMFVVFIYFILFLLTLSFLLL